MTSPQPQRLTRRGELLRAVSHAVRCLHQLRPDDSAAWRRDTEHFRNSIRSHYPDVLEHIPAEFERLLASDAPPRRPLAKLLEELAYEIQRETCIKPTTPSGPP